MFANKRVVTRGQSRIGAVPGCLCAFGGRGYVFVLRLKQGAETILMVSLPKAGLVGVMLHRLPAGADSVATM
jgi:hypothetical protein